MSCLVERMRSFIEGVCRFVEWVGNVVKWMRSFIVIVYPRARGFLAKGGTRKLIPESKCEF